MRNVFSLCFALTLLAMTASSLSAQDPSQKKAADPIRVLLITGDDVSAHDWRLISESTRSVLVESGKFDVSVCEDPMILESKTALERYDVIVMTLLNWKRVPTISDQAKANLLGFVKGGKGFYVQHLASGSFKEWPEYDELAGRRWKFGTSGHGPRSVFTANVAKTSHPITEGISDFPIDDELYAKLQGDREIEVLVSADSDWSNRTEPLLFVLKCGEGRCVHNAFGHDDKVITDTTMKKLITRSVEWAATGQVTPEK